jgi:hypothetical protein
MRLFLFAEIYEIAPNSRSQHPQADQIFDIQLPYFWQNHTFGPNYLRCFRVYVATSKIIVAICGSLLTGLFVAAFYEISTSKDFPASAKRIRWLFLFFVAAIIYVTYAKLTGSRDPT